MVNLIKEAPLTPEQIKSASSNYLRCLNLPPSSQILIVTDKLPGNPTDNMLTRTYLSSSLNKQISETGHPVATINFDDSTSVEDFRQQTLQALNELDEANPEGKIDRTTTIVYLGDDWSNRRGLYRGANEFGVDHKVKMGGSLGFTTGDCRVMSNIGEEEMGKLYSAAEYMDGFFKENPEGSFEITTRDADGKEHQLDLSYNTKKAPFVTELGNFDGVHESSLGEYKNVSYVNIPGGEKFGVPYPYSLTKGEFSAEGFIFTVEEGLVVGVSGEGSKPFEQYVKSQQELIGRLKNGEHLPLAELGLGLYEMAGIETYTDSSILSHEKSGPHIGIGHTYESVEEEVIDKLAGDFSHTDFVLDNPNLVWCDMVDANEVRKQFYPPLPKEDMQQFKHGASDLR